MPENNLTIPTPEELQQLHNLWKSMKNRCENPENIGYKNYGGRGIVVCEEWQIFENFVRDVHPRTSPRHSLDRVDNNGPYSPDNTRWATHTQQVRNTRRNRMVEENGQLISRMDWYEQKGITERFQRVRIENGWSVKEAVDTPKHRKRKDSKKPSKKKPTLVVSKTAEIKDGDLVAVIDWKSRLRSGYVNQDQTEILYCDGGKGYIFHVIGKVLEIKPPKD